MHRLLLTTIGLIVSHLTTIVGANRDKDPFEASTHPLIALRRTLNYSVLNKVIKL